ncbi:unnamed protein product, partial [marine sediment metagenome]
MKKGNSYHCTKCDKRHSKNSGIGLEHECYKLVQKSRYKRVMGKNCTTGNTNFLWNTNPNSIGWY